MFRLRLAALLPAALLSAVALVAGTTPTSVFPAAADGTRTVRYGGVELQVPADWPVVDYTHAGTGCVRLDRHVVYLGEPAVSDCPAHLVGATQAVEVAFTPVAPGPVARTHTAHGLLQTRSGAAGTPGLVQVPGDAGHATVTLSAAGDDPTTQAIADSVRRLAPVSGPAPAPAILPAASSTAASTYTTGQGFDACSAPTVGVMRSWLSSPYRTVGIYVGGVNRACSQTQLTAGWVTQVTAMGWSLIPTYVGLQAPCTSFSNRISPSSAASQGAAAADDAVNTMTGLGLPLGNPVYFDMEAYSTSNSTCVAAVEAFQDAWTARLHARGYVSGYYSSLNSGIKNMVQKAQSGGTAYHLPDDLWFAAWNGVNSTTDTSSPQVLPNGLWANHQRIHQYRGGHNETYAGVTINIDSDAVDGAVANPAQTPRVPSDVNGDGRSDLCVMQGINGYPTNSGKLELHCLNGASLYSSKLLDLKTPYSYVNTHTQLPLAMDADGDGRTDACLVSGLNGGYTGSGNIEVHCAFASGGFASSNLDVVTPWPSFSTHLAYPVALDANGDGYTDLCRVTGIDGHGTPSGHLEIDCLDGSKRYGALLLHAATQLPYASTWAQLPMGLDVDGDGKTDLCLLSGVNGYGTASGALEVRCVTAASGFTGAVVTENVNYPYIDTRTAYPVAFDVNADGYTDLCILVGLNGSTTSSGNLEVRCLDGAKRLGSTLVVARSAWGYLRTAANAFLVDSPVDVDTTPPAPYALPADAYRNSTYLVFGIGARDSQSGVASYDVRYRAAPFNGGFGGYNYPSYLQNVRASLIGINGGAGVTYCISVRARDEVHNLSGWSYERCSTPALDDRSLVAGTGWARVTGSAFYSDTATKATSAGRVLTRTGVVTRRLALVATTCPTCGSVSVYWNGTFLRNVSLASSGTYYKRVLYVTAFSGVASGTVTIRTQSSKVVYVDGLAISKV